jgi:hypothetical protein
MVVGPDTPGRAGLERVVRRLGHDVIAAAVPDGRCDVTMLDARDPSLDWPRLGDLPRPLVVVADTPRRLVGIRGDEGGVVVMTGRESDAGYRVALGVCAALADTAHPAS